MHQVVAQHSLPDMGLYQVGESPIPCQGASLVDLNHAWSWQATHPPPNRRQRLYAIVQARISDW